MKQLTPIELAIDAACGVPMDAEGVSAAKTQLAHETDAVMAVCDAAIRWSKSKTNEEFAVNGIALLQAANDLRAMGWT